MGTSGAYGGSGGLDFQRARRDFNAYLSGPGNRPGKANQALAHLADAAGWQGTAGLGGGTGTGGAGNGAGGGSRAAGRVGRVSGPALAAGLALRAGDAAGLAELGLDLAELAGLNPVKQCRRILDALVNSDGSIEDDEIRAASASALLSILDYGDGIDGAMAVRILVVEYVFEVALTEFGDQLRDGDRDGTAAVFDEDALKDMIRATVDQVEVPDGLVRPDQFEHAVATSLGSIRGILGAVR